MAKFRSISVLGTLLLAPTTLSACSSAGQQTGEPSDLAQAAQELYGNTSIYWTGFGTNRIDLEVCWANPNEWTAAVRDNRRQAVEESWGRFGRINFWGWDTCTNPDTANLQVYICDMADGDGDGIPNSAEFNSCPGNPDPNDQCCPAICTPGQQNGSACNGNPPPCCGNASQANTLGTGLSGKNLNQSANGIRMNENHLQQTFVHEFGHALGYYHEEERNCLPGAGNCNSPDAPPTNPPNCPAVAAANSNPMEYGSYDPTSTMSYCTPPGAAPWLSPTDIAAVGRHYSRRIPGSLASLRSNCAAAHYSEGNSAPVFLWDCDEANDDQEWRDDTGLGADGDWNLYLFGAQGDFCLWAEGDTAGSEVFLLDCSSATDWKFQDTYIRGFGGKCLDVPGGNTTNGTRLQVWDCGPFDGNNQRWRITRDREFRFGSTGKCAQSINGQLQLWTCDGGADQRFNLLAGGRVSTQGGTSGCLDVQGPNDSQFVNATNASGAPTNGAFVNVLSCNSTVMNQKWVVSGQIRWGANTNLCLNRPNDTPAAGQNNTLNLLTCSSSAWSSITPLQHWDYYWH